MRKIGSDLSCASKPGCAEWLNLRLMYRLLTAMLLGSVLACSPRASLNSVPILSVNVASGRHAIDPNIYGIVNYGLDADFAREIKVPNVRWGGDGTTRYNWQVDSSNSGFDWYFLGGNGVGNPIPGGSVDALIRRYSPAGTLVTIPIIPYVNKTAAWNCSFPVSVYGAQQSTNPYTHPNGDDCGNGMAADGKQLLDKNIYANHVDNSAELQAAWVQHLLSTFGTAAKGGVPFYQLDNEPYGWGNTHRDIEPGGAAYSTITALGQKYAAAVKQVDPTAAVMGPSDFTLGGWIGDTKKQDGLYAAEYYLQQMAAYEKAHSVRILDYLDEHYYPVFSDAASQLASTRTLWDPTYDGGTWVEQDVFKAPMQLLPRMQGWVSTYYPGTKLAISEYSIDSGKKLITDALAEMDLLGIFGRQRLDFANMWTAPGPTDPIAFAFRIFRNYDGHGSQYGDTWVSASSSNEGRLSVYAAQRKSDGALTVLVINKTTSVISSKVQVAGMSLPPTASVFMYSGDDLKQIVSRPAVTVSDGGIAYAYPGYSATLFVVAVPVKTSSTPQVR